jgi:signal-transduction protein with cAMP-binding, CBS, and nucleotidyltransferase domain
MRKLEVTSGPFPPPVERNRHRFEIARRGLRREIDERDIAMRAVADGADAQTTSVGDVASRDPVTVEPEQDLDEALTLMARHRVRRLPVVEGGRLVGILAQADVAGQAKEKRTGEMLEEISKPG